ncbi:hypothetical protein FA15DRAFT_648126 [Coprinopsis marcescibilis]|uniref:HNH domain-containing protein n=1 Tax=Coprinopsis marcescibilis TaxID=230819 RepID=A0A5C3KIH7_COPMA|nr:hypothetical protein FA15DRAFT_648126 [Coprinopsis marcescibilis]
MSSESSLQSSQFHIFKDSLAAHLLGKKISGEAEELDDFASYLAEEAWPILPSSYQIATFEDRDSVQPRPTADNPIEKCLSLEALSASFVETFISYGLAPDADHDQATKFLYKVIEDYLEQACAPPPVWSTTRTSECEICDREVPLTYHHLIPRSTHSKVLKKGWHHESMLNKVAWLCRHCHSAVHRVASNEELAQHYHTIELLLEREDIQRWQKYAAKQKWKPRPKKAQRQPIV